MKVTKAGHYINPCLATEVLYANNYGLQSMSDCLVYLEDQATMTNQLNHVFLMSLIIKGLHF